jgi:hypothetical protein
MLEWADPGNWRELITGLTGEFRKVWDTVMVFYDSAMRGSKGAQKALCAAHRRIRFELAHQEYLERSLGDCQRNATELARVRQQLELELGEQRQRAHIFETKLTVAQSSYHWLERIHHNAMAADEAEICSLEEIITQWERLAGVGDAPPAADVRVAEHERRFRVARDLLGEAQAAAAEFRSECESLQDRCDRLKKRLDKATKGAAKLREERKFLLKERINSKAMTAEWTQREQSLRSLIEAERKSTLKQQEQHRDHIERLTKRYDEQLQEKQTKINRLEKEAALSEAKLMAFKEVIDRLNQRHADRMEEAARDMPECKNMIKDLSTTIAGLDATIASVLNAREIAPGTDSPSKRTSFRDSLRAEEAIRLMEAAQLQKIQSSWAAIDEMRAGIARLEERFATKASDKPASPLSVATSTSTEQLDILSSRSGTSSATSDSTEEGRTALSEDLARLGASLNVIGTEHEALMQGRSEIEDFLNTLRETLISQQRKLERDGGPPSGNEPDNVAIKSLNEAVALIPQLKTESLRITDCVDKLQEITDQLNSVTPDSSAKLLITSLKEFLERAGKGRASEFSAAETATLSVQEERLQGLIDMTMREQKQFEQDWQYLAGIRRDLDFLEAREQEQMELVGQYQSCLKEHFPGCLRPEQSQELWRLVNNFVESSSRDGLSTGGRLSPSAVDALLVRVQKLTVNEQLLERLWQLRETMTLHDTQRTNAASKISQFFSLINSIHMQIQGIDDARQGRESQVRADPEYSQERREMLVCQESRLRWENSSNQDRIHQLIENRSRMDVFLGKEADRFRRHAEQLVAETLLKMQIASRLDRHPEAVCFCALLRFFFPDVYYSAVHGGCCSGGRVTASSYAVPVSHPTPFSQYTYTTASPYVLCQGHHGHGPLASSSPLYTLLCQALTSLIWLCLLILLQPYNLKTAAAFMFSVLCGIPTHLYRRARHAYRRHRRLRAQRNTTTTSSQEEKEDPPPMLEPFLPPPSPSAWVGVALTFFLLTAWVSYLAVLAERSLWLGHNGFDWRIAYVRDLSLPAPRGMPYYPYPFWTPFWVDFRLLVDPVLVFFEETVLEDWLGSFPDKVADLGGRAVDFPGRVGGALLRLMSALAGWVKAAAFGTLGIGALAVKGSVALANCVATSLGQLVGHALGVVIGPVADFGQLALYRVRAVTAWIAIGVARGSAMGNHEGLIWIWSACKLLRDLVVSAVLAWASGRRKLCPSSAAVCVLSLVELLCMFFT